MSEPSPRSYARPSASARIERRASRRSLCSRKAFCHPPAAEEEYWRPAKVVDISTDGIGLIVDRRLAAGAFFEVELITTERNLVCTMLVRVVRAAMQPGGHWFVGGAFVNKLSQDELKTWLSAGTMNARHSAGRQQRLCKGPIS